MEPKSILNEDGFVHFDLLLPVELRDVFAERAEKNGTALYTEIVLTLNRSARSAQAGSEDEAPSAQPAYTFPSDEELQERIKKFLSGK